MSNEITPYAVDDLLKPLLLKDLRIQCRARGLNPGGGRETLFERLKENMLKTGNTELVSEAVGQTAAAVPGETQGAQAGDETLKNNYVRPEGQNVGNFITDRPSSRVLAPPGGGSNISLG
ncbi:Protein SPIRAL1 [Picochlorum sp. SENEW3]|nr:Protein SPIRAL1 [Picochlorum sp. SENEW3]